MATNTKISDAEALAMFESGEGFDPNVYRTPADTADIRAAVQVRATATQMVDDAVLAARREGLTWVEISAALGVSPQAARKKYLDQV